MSTVSKISFGTAPFKSSSQEERRRRQPLLSSIANMSDSEIIQASVKSANKQAENIKAARALKNGPLMFIAAASITSGALAKGGLSNKALTAAASFALYGAALAISEPVYDLTGKVMDLTSRDKDKKPSYEHPILRDILGLGAFMGACAIGMKGISKGAGRLAENFAPAVQKAQKEFIKGADLIDNSHAGKLTDKITKSAEKFQKSNPKAAKFTKNLIEAFPFLAFIGNQAGASVEYINRRDEIAISNANRLSFYREAAREAIETK